MHLKMSSAFSWIEYSEFWNEYHSTKILWDAITNKTAPLSRQIFVIIQTKCNTFFCRVQHFLLCGVRNLPENIVNTVPADAIIDNVARSSANTILTAPVQGTNVFLETEMTQVIEILPLRR